MAPTRIIYSLTRCWRCYFLLLIASILSFFLIYVSQNDPNLEYYFPYFRLGSNYYNFYASGGAEKIKKLMEANYLDYEFLNSNSRYCVSKSLSSDRIDEDYAILNDYPNNAGTSKELKNTLKGSKSDQLDFILLIISQAANFKHRIAARYTWAKSLPKLNSKLIFIIGNPFYKSKDSSGHSTSQFTSQDQTKLDKEIKEYDDMIQINMPDHENYTSTKTLISIRWTLTYCSNAKNLFILSDSAILNLSKFESMIKNQSALQKIQNDSTITGQCDYTDENFALALRLFFNDLYKKQKKESVIVTEPNKSANLTLNAVEEGKSDKKGAGLGKMVENYYKGQYCSNLGWIVTLNGARRLWLTALRSPYMMKISPAYLNGYLAFKANLKHSNLFKYHDLVPLTMNCLKVFETSPSDLLCAENFTIASRYSNYIATWNSPAQGHMVLPKA